MRSLVVAALAAMGSLAAFAKTPPVPFRGVVEGYYGRPWGTEGRLSLLSFMGENGMNVFIYGPKDDPYHHYKWREAYPEAEMRDFDRLLKAAKANGINFYWAVHLGDAFRKGEEEKDFADLFRKLEGMYAGGFRSFAVFFDDFGGSDARLHAEICNRVVRDFLEKKGDCAPLVMCPNAYSGMGHPYQRALGAALDKRVNIMWTGRGICSDISAEDVRAITADFQRPPFIWWNWPVNDYCRSRLLLGRTCGLAACPVAGFVSNPMENAEASKIALYGIARWCLDPEGFDSEKVYAESFAKLYGEGEIAAAMRTFAAHNADPGPTCHNFRRGESVAAAPLCARVREALERSGRVPDEEAKALGGLFREVGSAARTLLAKLPKNRYDLGWEIEGWLAIESSLMDQGLLALDLAAATESAAETAIVRRLVALRREADAAFARHREKFAAATFPDDRCWIQRPAPSARHLAPTVAALLEHALGGLYERRFGTSFAAAGGFAAFSGAKALATPQVRLDERRYAGFVRVMEPKEIAPGESFGLHVPNAWQTDYFHARLGSEKAVSGGVIELSRDGATWTKLATRNAGAEMQARLEVADGWRWARYRNVSAESVSVKLELFKFDIRGATSTIDGLLEALAK